MPRPNKGKVPGTNYPRPKKHERLMCLACGGKKKIFDGQFYWTCRGCKGKGYIQAH